VGLCGYAVDSTIHCLGACEMDRSGDATYETTKAALWRHLGSVDLKLSPAAEAVWRLVAEKRTTDDIAVHLFGASTKKAVRRVNRQLSALYLKTGIGESPLESPRLKRQLLEDLGELLFSHVGAAAGIAQDLRAYYEGVVAQCGSTPWRHGDGRQISVQDIAIPIRVLKEERRPVAGFAAREPEEERGEARWSVVMGEPGGGKTFLAALTAVSGAQEGPHSLQEGTPGEPEEKRKRGREKVASRHMAGLCYPEPGLQRRGRVVHWEEERGEARWSVILGEPGDGKTFLAALTAVSLAQEGLHALQEGTALEELPLPVHLDLTDLARALTRHDDPQTGLLKVLRQHSASSLGDPFWRWFGERVRTQQGWLILDALDQVPQEAPQEQRGALYAALHTWLQQLEHQGWRSRRILTCRRANYDRSWLPWREVTEYVLAPFEPSAIRRFTDRWFEEDPEKAASLNMVLEGSYPLAHACRSPLVTTLLCLVHDDQPLAEGVRRQDLYGRALRLLLKRPWQNRGETWSAADLDGRLWVLERLAWSLFPKEPASQPVRPPGGPPGAAGGRTGSRTDPGP